MQAAPEGADGTAAKHMQVNEPKEFKKDAVKEEKMEEKEAAAVVDRAEEAVNVADEKAKGKVHCR